MLPSPWAKEEVFNPWRACARGYSSLSVCLLVCLYVTSFLPVSYSSAHISPCDVFTLKGSVRFLLSLKGDTYVHRSIPFVPCDLVVLKEDKLTFILQTSLL